MPNEVVYASDIIEEAQNLAQVKALNSFSFREILRLLNEIYGYTYEQVALVDDGYWSKTVRLTDRLTPLPPHIKNTIKVYTAQDIQGFNRTMFKPVNNRTLTQSRSFCISGMDLYCADAVRWTVWMEYIPEPPLLTYTQHNRDPKIITDVNPLLEVNTFPDQQRYGAIYISREKDGEEDRYTGRIMSRPVLDSIAEPMDITTVFDLPDSRIVTLLCDFPYVFVSYRHKQTNDPMSVIHKDIFGSTAQEWRYNAFDYLGRPTQCIFIKAKYNDYTGLGVTIYDDTDGQYKELGWTPDTIITYPAPIMRTYIVAKIAQRLADRNSSNIMEVERVLADSSRSLNMFLKRNQATLERIQNTVGPTLSDYLG